MEKTENPLDVIKNKAIAVASGKGGVGKTTTCVNIAVYFARKGLRTGLLDLDPLSDVATLLDLSGPEAAAAGVSLSADDFDKNRIAVLPKLDLIFPDSIQDKDEKLHEKLIRFSEAIATEYDILLFDLPAGSGYEENLIFLQYASRLIIVTNDEPASHAASGHYIKTAHEGGLNPEFLIWHNKYAGITISGFDPGDLPGNYNKNTAEEDRFDFDLVNMKDAAFIPEDPAMDLLRSNPSLSVNILAQISERLDFLIEQRIDELSWSVSLPEKSGGLIRHYLHLNPFIRDIETSYKKISEYIYALLNTKTLSGSHDYNKQVIEGGLEVFSLTEKEKITELLNRVKNDSLMSELVRTSAQVKIAVDDQNNTGRMFFSGTDGTSLKAVDKRISRLLQLLHSERNNHNDYFRSTAGLLLFDFSLYKLLASETVKTIITDFIPVRKNKKGEQIRDKHLQILQLINEEKNYKDGYLNLINTLFPVILKQIATVVETFNTPGLLFNDKKGVRKDVYLKLLSTFLHNSINSGLGIIVGFPFRPASAAFEKSAGMLLG